MKNILKYAIVLVGIGLMSSCEKFLDVNTDPNNPVSVTPDLILPTGQNYSARVFGRDRRINSLGNMLMYNWSQSDGYAWYPDEFKYNVTTTFYDNIFEETFTTAMKQYEVLENLEDEFVYYQAIAMIMKVFHYQILVDMYGDIPYSEALGRSENATPAYDDAQTVYEDLIVKLTDAIDLITNADELAEEVGDDDAMFGGDMDAWIAFANSLKIRILTRQSDMAGRDAYITAELQTIADEGSGFISGDVAINPGYLAGEENKQNPFWDELGWDAGGTATLSNKATCATDYIIDYLTTTNDPRIDFIYETPGTGHLGVPQGLLDYDTPVKDAYIPELVSNIGPGIFKGGDMGVTIYTLAELYLNLAELAEKGLYTDETAENLYNMGIAASFAYLGAPDAATYYGQLIDNVNYGVSTDKIEAIITQKWIATNGITAEQSWFDYNRTGFPADLPISMQATTDDRPVRLMYPASEVSSNGDNLPTQPDAFTDKIFWAN